MNIFTYLAEITFTAIVAVPQKKKRPNEKLNFLFSFPIRIYMWCILPGWWRRTETPYVASVLMEDWCRHLLPPNQFKN